MEVHVATIGRGIENNDGLADRHRCLHALVAPSLYRIVVLDCIMYEISLFMCLSFTSIRVLQ